MGGLHVAVCFSSNKRLLPSGVDIRMNLRTILFTIIWLMTMLFAFQSGAWKAKQKEYISKEEARQNSNYHMHNPLHPGGKVSMAGQFHLELVSQKDGAHRLWVSNAFRQEMDPAGFVGKLTIEYPDGKKEEIPFKRLSRKKELVAKSKPIKGQVWLTIDGMLGSSVPFKKVKFFWDYEAKMVDLNIPLGLDSMLPMPIDNPLTTQKIELGRELFFDELLSADGTVSCATCHRPDHGFAEPLAISKGIAGRTGKRNALTILNTAYYRTLFWDGRSASLERQAVRPIFDHAEMGFKEEAKFVERIDSKYGTRIKKAFGKPTALRTIAKAIACYERTLLSGDSDFDRFESGEHEAISPSAQRGRSLFFGKARCGSCHIPPLFSDHEFHNLGVGNGSDPGRFAVTEDPKDKGAFRTPSLRNATLTAPYMHDGSVASLREVLEFYNAGAGDNPLLDPIIQPLDLSDDDIEDLLTFLQTLEGRFANSKNILSGKNNDGKEKE